MRPRVEAAQKTLDELKARAHHEASHAVLGLLAGEPLQSVTVIEGISSVPGFEGERTGGGTFVDTSWRPGRSDPSGWLRACATVAGVYGEERYSGRWNQHGAAGDISQFKILTDKAATVGMDVFEPICRLSKTFVEAWWPAITEVAEDLLELGTVSGEQVRATMVKHAPWAAQDFAPDLRTCRHEAAHAIAAIALGVPIDGVHAVPMPGGVMGQALMLEGEFSPAGLVAVLAGPAFDRVTEQPQWEASARADFALFERMVKEDVKPWMAWAWPRAKALVERFTKEICTVGDYLKQRRFILTPEINYLAWSGEVPPSVDLGPIPARDVLLDSPLVYYRLGETEGLTAADASGNGGNATYSGSGITFSQPDPITDDVDGAVTMDGTTYLAQQTSHVPSSAGPWTIELWFKTTSSGTPRAFVSFRDDIAVLYLTTSGGIGIAAPVGGTFAGSGYNDGNWHLLHATYDGTDVQAFVDLASVFTTAASWPSPFDKVRIGGEASGSRAPFVGSLDEVAIYNTVLSSARRSAHYDARNGGLNDVTGERMERIATYVGLPA